MTFAFIMLLTRDKESTSALCAALSCAYKSKLSQIIAITNYTVIILKIITYKQPSVCMLLLYHLQVSCFLPGNGRFPYDL